MVTSYSYDNQGNRLNIYLPDATITNSFDALGRKIQTCDAWGCHEFAYNNQSLPVGITNAFGTEQFTVFDDEDRPIYVTDANQVTLTNTYDVLHRLATRTYPDGGVERFGYSARGLIAYTNQLNLPTHYGYDAALRKVAETNANSQTLYYTNDAAGDLLALMDGKGQVTQWGYDLFGRNTNKLDQTGAQILSYGYDADNRLTSRKDALGIVTTYSYDNVGNLTNVTYSDGSTPAVTFTYDALNRVSTMVDGVGTNVYGYTTGGFLFTEDGPFANDTVTNLYSNRLRTGLGLQQPSGSWTNGFTYDAAKRLTSVKFQAGEFDYTYDSTRLGLVDNISLPNGCNRTNTYDPVARLLSTLLKDSGGTALDAAEYGYNVGNQRNTYTNLTRTNAYVYDNISQLTVATNAISAENRGYLYDAAWNLNTLTNDGVTTTYTVNNRNELTFAGVLEYLYDANGNITNRQATSGTNIDLLYGYDGENRLISVQVNVTGTPTGLTTFVYDGLGRMREQLQWTNSGGGAGPGSPGVSWGESGGTLYVYDGKRVIQERSISNAPTVSYTRGNDLSGTMEGAGGIGGLLARTAGSVSTFYQSDGNGNITSLVDASESLVASYRYDPFGNLISSSGTLATANTYRFSSKEYIPSVGIYYYLYRFYDPGAQRWINRDPIGELSGVNLFVIAGNNLINRIDLLGLSWLGHLLGKVPVVGGVLGGIGDTLTGVGNVGLGVVTVGQSGTFNTGMNQINQGVTGSVLGVIDVTGKCWNAPNTALGIAVGTAGMAFGGSCPTSGNNAIEFPNCPLMFAGNLTLGNTILFNNQIGPSVSDPGNPGYTYGDHEGAHTIQGEFLGPFYLPANLIGGIISTIEAPSGDPDPWHYNNFMENGPQQGPPVPW